MNRDSLKDTMGWLIGVIPSFPAENQQVSSLQNCLSVGSPQASPFQDLPLKQTPGNPVGKADLHFGRFQPYLFGHV